MNYKLDTDTHVFFYEQEFYVLSNFSAFKVLWHGITFMTSEHAYQWTKFFYDIDKEVATYEAVAKAARLQAVRSEIRNARSAHDAFKKAQKYTADVDPRWPDIKLRVMHDILIAKCEQHEYVRRKLEETGSRVLVEDSWRDDFWGIGESNSGQNHLGVLWMQVREEMRGGYGREAVQ